MGVAMWLRLRVEVTTVLMYCRRPINTVGCLEMLRSLQVSSKIERLPTSSVTSQDDPTFTEWCELFRALDNG